jgi:oxysterol-binding protein-related protein 9/10/11
MDLGPLYPVAKTLPPVDAQLPNESSRFWSGLTYAILNKQLSAASNIKHQIEERQREKAAERKEKGVEWQPRFFTGAVTPIGRPDLTDEGREELEKMHKGIWDIEPSVEMGAM